MIPDTQSFAGDTATLRPFTVQCGCVSWLTNIVTVEATNIDDACILAIEAANADSAWRTADSCGPTYVDVVAEGEDFDPWLAPGPHLPVPPRFAEDGEARMLRAALLGLLDWAAAMGGWDAEAWRVAERVTGRSGPDGALVE